jgi:hypothetical protein
MSRPMSRRTAAKLLLAAPAAIAAPALLGEPPTTPAKSRGLSAAERRQLDRSVGQLRGAAAKIRAMKIPIGTEPAFVFRPLPPKK